METRRITDEELRVFADRLRQEERSEATIEKYIRDVGEFAAHRKGGEVTKEAVLAWKEALLSSGLAPATVNSKLCALNGLFRVLGWEDCRVKSLRLQRRVFRESSQELSRQEYMCLVKTARAQGKERLALLLEAICSTGIRVSEVRYLTVEAARACCADVHLKGKVRTILLTEKLCRKLLKYAEKRKIVSGEIFLTRRGASLSRKQIWREMKSLCEKAGVKPSKVFPHNLRHLFAARFYWACQDIVKLADMLGHSSIETTRIYLITAGEEHARYLESLALVF